MIVLKNLALLIILWMLHRWRRTAMLGPRGNRKP